MQLALRKDIESLRDRIRFFSIAGVPLLVAVLAIGLGHRAAGALPPPVRQCCGMRE